MALTILIVVVVVALAAAFFMLTRRDAVAAPAASANFVDEAEDGVVSEPVPVNGTAQGSEPDRITWLSQFDPNVGVLDDAGRMRLINDLALLRATWCIPLLEQACREESDPAHRAAAERALASCREHRPGGPAT
jgi:hypothetical protein